MLALPRISGALVSPRGPGRPGRPAWAGGDERPHAVLSDGYQVELAVKRDCDSVPARGAAVGEPGVVAELAAGADRLDAAERARAGGGRSVLGAVTPDPGFGLQLRSVAVAVHEREAVAVIAGQGDHAGVAGMPSAVAMTSAAVSGECPAVIGGSSRPEGSDLARRYPVHAKTERRSARAALPTMGHAPAPAPAWTGTPALPRS